ncbi:SLAP domain-containing protein [Desulfotomaculum sp. 1211_IL3151]|uniref:SLAP domain-containing protein n=1 Tax=Desulfotomaculum sp. 1211_IL3151 TaxID=3084055 RepID=UPI002FDA7F7A
MFEVFKNFFEKKQSTAGDVLMHDPVFIDKDNNVEDRPFAKIKLSLPLEVENKMSNSEKKFLKKEVAELPKIKVGDVSVVGVYIVEAEQNFDVGVYFQNGLNRPVKFDILALIIMNLENKVLGRQLFNLKDLGVIPSFSARPTQLFFDKSNLYVDEISNENWKIAFDLMPKDINHVDVVLDDSIAGLLPESFSEAFTDLVKRRVAKLPSMKPNALDISLFSTKMVGDEQILVSVIVRNSYGRSVKLEKLPLTLIDAAGNDIASGIFYPKEFIVKPLTVNLFTFRYRQEHIIKKGMDISNCAIKLSGPIV